MNDAVTLPRHMLDVRELTAEAFAPYGQIIAPLRTGGQGTETGYDPETSTSEAKLVLHNGEPRLWIMHLPHVGLGFTTSPNAGRVLQSLLEFELGPLVVGEDPTATDWLFAKAQARFRSAALSRSCFSILERTTKTIRFMAQT